MTFDPREHVEYLPPAFTDASRFNDPDEASWGDGYGYEEDRFPVALTDDMIMRAHYLDLGMSQLLQKKREGTLSDQEYIQYYRMNGELRGLLRHIWSVGKRGLELWMQAHMMGALVLPFDVVGLMSKLRDLGLDPGPALGALNRQLDIDEGAIQRWAIGLDPWDDSDDEENDIEGKLSERGISSVSDYDLKDDEIWEFLIDEMGEADETMKMKVIPYNRDATQAQEFLEGEGWFNPEEDYSSYHQGFIDADDSGEDKHVRMYGDIRLDPEYQSAIEETIYDDMDPINNIRSHRGLLDELNMDEEQWNELDTQSQMGLISRLMQAEHGSGNILTDYTPDFRFESGRYEPRGDWVGWRLGNQPSPESNALRQELDDLHDSPMVRSWDEMMQKNPHRRWSEMAPRMTRMAEFGPFSPIGGRMVKISKRGAKCPICGQEYFGSSSCIKRLEGQKVFGEHSHDEMAPETCHDCGVSKGGYHHFDCDMDWCPDCGVQLCIDHDCDRKEIEWKSDVSRLASRFDERGLHVFADRLDVLAQNSLFDQRPLPRVIDPGKQGRINGLLDQIRELQQQQVDEQKKSNGLGNTPEGASMKMQSIKKLRELTDQISKLMMQLEMLQRT